MDQQKEQQTNIYLISRDDNTIFALAIFLK